MPLASVPPQKLYTLLLTMQALVRGWSLDIVEVKWNVTRNSTEKIELGDMRKDVSSAGSCLTRDRYWDNRDVSGKSTVNQRLPVWRDHVVPVQFDSQIASPTKINFLESMRAIEDNTCIRFCEDCRNSERTLHIRILNPAGCSVSLVGVTSSNPEHSITTLQLSHNTCSPGSGRELVLHELFHVFGIMHTQTRPDRDQHIYVNEKQINPIYLSQFEICQHCNAFGLPYECNSVMHYGPHDFSLYPWGPPVMSPLSSSCRRQGLGMGMPTPTDWKMLRLAQNCPIECPENDWYPYHHQPHHPIHRPHHGHPHRPGHTGGRPWNVPPPPFLVPRP